MTFRLLFALLAIAVGLLGLGLNMYVIGGTMFVTPDNPVARSLPNFLIYFLSFLTNLSNIALLVIYIADLGEARRLGWFRDPVTKAGMAGIMTLVMLFYHFMLGPNLPDVPPAIDVSNVLLHYVTPLMFLGWWLAYSPHGTLRYRDLPIMLVPGLAYVGYILLRGLVTGEYPYTILDPTFAIPGQPPGGYLAVAIGVGVLVALVAIFDLLLIFIDGLIARRRQPA